MINVIHGAKTILGDNLSRSRESSIGDDLQFFSDLLASSRSDTEASENLKMEESRQALAGSQVGVSEGEFADTPAGLSQQYLAEEFAEINTFDQLTKHFGVENYLGRRAGGSDDVLKIPAQIYYHWYASGSLVSPLQMYSASSVSDTNSASDNFGGAEYPTGFGQQPLGAASNLAGITPNAALPAVSNLMNVNGTKSVSLEIAGSSAMASYSKAANMPFLSLYRYEKTRISLVNNQDETSVYVRDYYSDSIGKSEWRNASSLFAQKKTIDVYLNGEKIR